MMSNQTRIYLAGLCITLASWILSVGTKNKISTYDCDKAMEVLN